LVAEIDLKNLNVQPDLKKLIKATKSDQGSSSSNDDVSDEDFEDYRIEGYHCMAIK
jgi:hypothetical protein